MTVTSSAERDVTSADDDTPEYRKQRITALQRELSEALAVIGDAAKALTDAGVPDDGMTIAERIRWLVLYGDALAVQAANRP